MYRKRRVYSRWGRRRLKIRRKFFQMWSLSHRIKKKARLSVMRKYLLALREEVGVAIRLREIELKLYRDAEMQAELPKLVMNLVFTSTNQDNASIKSIQRVARQATMNGFFNSAFASVEHFPDRKKGRVQHMRVLHMKARQAIVKKIVQRMFLLWKRVHMENKRIGLNAQLCIKRAARMAFGSRPVWAGEKLMIIFSIWSRWAAFSRCMRSGSPLPQYTQALPQWDIWVYNHQERQVRKVKAAAKAPLTRMRRYFYRLRTFSGRSVEKRAQLQTAMHHYVQKITREILLSWREEIAEGAFNKKLCRFVIAKLRGYAIVKAKLRPLKQAVAQQKQLWDFSRAWRAWKGVHLRSFFKRELNVSKLEQSQWRSKVHRIIYVWMDAKHQVNRWRTFEAWRNLCRKRRLFQTLRFHCERIRKRHLLFGILNAWKAFVWKQEDVSLEDRLKLSAWDVYEELSPFFPMLFYGSYSAAAAIFGGVEVKPEEGQEHQKRLPYQSDSIRQFQSVITQGSVAEVRNAVLQSKHLINAVDDASGNTPLHMAMQVEDPTHRIDMLSLLLSEGAVTWHHSNRHGLTPKQLANDEDSKLLLDKGIYAFYANKVLQLNNAKKVVVDETVSKNEETSASSEQRFMWCMITLMSSEWVRGVRLAGDIKVREWHSVLKEELWLRQERIIFASTSHFSPAILRCRAFLNGMKKKLARSCDQVLEKQVRKRVSTSIALPSPFSEGHQQLEQDNVKPLPVRRSLSRALHSRGLLRGQQYVSMLTKIVDANDSYTHAKATQEEEDRMLRAKMLGDLEPYARFLLTPTLDCELAEKALVHSFVGVLFSLEFPVHEVLEEAYRLDDVCSSLEHNVLTLHALLERAQWKVSSFAVAPSDASLLCCFATELDMDLHFTKEIFFLRLAAHTIECQKHQEGSTATDEVDGDEMKNDDHSHPGLQETQQKHEPFIKEAKDLATKLQRKMRKIEKKKRTLEGHLAESESTYRAKLFSVTRTVREISEARMVLERARLRMASVLLKYRDLQTEIETIEKIKRCLVSGQCDLNKLPCKFLGDSMGDESAHKKAFLEAELARCTQSYRTKELFSDEGTSATASTTLTASPATASSCLEVRRLYKETKTALRLLFVANLFRCCCCWLAENMIPPPVTADENKLEDQPVNDERQDHSKALARPNPTLQKRRSSVSNVRKIVETPHRAPVATETAERDANLMLENYASSAGLLFEKERLDMTARKKQLSEEQSSEIPIIQELNPITRQPEDPPEHLLDQAGAIVSSNSARHNARLKAAPRNRKREELRKAIVEHQLKRVAAGDTRLSGDGDDRDDVLQSEESTSTASQLPSLHGSSIEFGNFVVGGVSQMIARAEMEAPQEERYAVAAPDHRSSVEAMWKRGARGSDNMAATSKASSEIFTSVVDEVAFNASFRVLSASRDRRSISASRVSSAGKASSMLESPQPLSASERRNSRARKTEVQEIYAEPSSSPAAFESHLGHNVLASDFTEESEVVQEITLSFRVDDVKAGEQHAEEAELEFSQSDETSAQESGLCESEKSQDRERNSINGDQVTVEAEFDLIASDETSLPEALEEHLRRIREEAAEPTNAPAITTVPAANDSSDRDKRHSQRRSNYGGDTENSDAFAGSRFLSFIKWEKKGAALAETISPLSHIFQDAPARGSSYSQEERDVKQVQKTTKTKKKQTAVMRTQAETNLIMEAAAESSESSLSDALSDPSTLQLHGKAAVLTESRKKAAGTSGDQDEKKETARAMDLVKLEAEDFETAIPRISITVMQSRSAEMSTSQTGLDTSPQHQAVEFANDVSASATMQFDLDVLQLQGHGMAQGTAASKEPGDLRTRELSKATKKLPSSKKASKWQFQEPRAQTSSTLPRQYTSATLTELQLDGAKVGSSVGAVMTKSQSTMDMKTKKSAMGRGGGTATPVELSKQQKQQVWDEFASLSLSEGVQNAYSVLYPHIYAPTASAQPMPSHVQHDSKLEEISEKAQVAAAVQGSLPPQPKVSEHIQKDLTNQYTGGALQMRSMPDLRRNHTSSVELDKKFWSAVEGYKSVGAASSVLILDAKVLLARRKEIASRIHDEFLHERSHRRLDWIDMYPDEVRSVTTHLSAAPKNLFNALQQTAQLRISTAVAQRHS